MRQPFWKKMLSYFKEVHIESASSIYNDQLTVLLSKGEYQLCTPEAIYSYGNRYDNYFSAFEKLDIQGGIDDVLVLGLGLGSIPYMLEKHFKKNYTYTAVEIDETVIDLASKYVLNSLDSEILTICADALHFVEIDQHRYDMIAMDIFVSDYIPEVFESLEYLQTLKETLTDDGIILFNRLYFFDHDKRKTAAYFENVFLKVFPQGRYLDINGNWILTNK